MDVIAFVLGAILTLFMPLREADLSVEVAPAGEDRPPQYASKGHSIQANVSVPEGKTIVVGKAGAGGATRGVFLVLTAKVVD